MAIACAGRDFIRGVRVCVGSVCLMLYCPQPKPAIKIAHIAVMLFQRIFRNVRGKARGDTRCSTEVFKCVPNIEVSESTVARDYRCAHLFGLVRQGYLLSWGVSRHRDFGAFVIPSCVGRVSFRESCFLSASRRVSGGFRV